jgi:TatD DNase family protein
LLEFDLVLPWQNMRHKVVLPWQNIQHKFSRARRRLRFAVHAHPLIDIGANLTHSSFQADLNQVIQAAFDAGVVQMLITGASKEGSVAAMQLAQAWPGQLYATAGIHPHHASEFDAFTEELLADLLANDLVKAGGECGLDYNRNFSPKDAQIFAFERQLGLAIAANKPVFLHQRDAHDDFLAILKQARASLVGAVVHCFTDTRAALADYLQLDCYIGVTGWICDERRGAHLLAAVPDIPDDRLLIETDAPYLLPRTIRPAPKDRRNVPAYLPAVLETLAHARGQSPAHVAQITTANARRLFGLEEAKAEARSDEQ